MNKIFFLSIVLTFTALTHVGAQNIEKSVTGIQLGYLGTWAHHEFKLKENLSLRVEAGLDFELFGGIIRNNTNQAKVDYISSAVFTLSPRWYYNLKKRSEKSKNTTNNTGSFIELKTSYRPDLLVFSSNKNAGFFSNMIAIPTWGVRRVFWRHFAVEAGVGLGYRVYFIKGAKNKDEAEVNLHIRVGYNF